MPIWQDERDILHDLHIVNTCLLKPRSHHWYVWQKKIAICGYFPRRAKHVLLKIVSREDETQFPTKGKVCTSNDDITF